MSNSKKIQYTSDNTVWLRNISKPGVNNNSSIISFSNNYGKPGDMVSLEGRLFTQQYGNLKMDGKVYTDL